MIWWVIKYTKFRENYYDVMYRSGRMKRYIREPDLPKTVLHFIESTEKRFELTDPFDGSEMLYVRED